MEEKPPRPMTPFDTLFTPPFLYTLKLLLPYTPPEAQRSLAVFIKFSEFCHVLREFHRLASRPTDSILEDIKPYLSPEEQESFSQVENIMSMMSMMEMMQSMPAGTDPDLMQSIGALLNPIEKGEFHEQHMDQSPGSEKYGSCKTGTDQDSCGADQREIR